MMITKFSIMQQGAFSRLMLFVSFLIFSNTTLAEDIALDRIAAVVNNDVVMVSDVRRTVSQLKKRGKINVSDRALAKQVLDKLIIEKIQIQKAKEIGIKIDDVAVDEAMSSIARQNKLDLQQFRVALIKEGFDYKNFRENIRDRLYMESIIKRQRGRRGKISENEIDDLIRSESFLLNKDVQYHLIDVLLPNPNGTSVKQFNANLKRTQSLRNQLLARADIPPSILKKVGATSNDLGWRSSSTLSPAFLRVLSTLSPGELSSVVRDSSGFHILKIIEQKGGKRKISQQVQARHILIPVTEPKGRLKATQIRNKILAGESFAKIAKEQSADKGSAEKGGDLGMADLSNYVPPFAKAVGTLPLNTLSHPIQTRFGWHIIEVMQRRKSDQTREAIKLQAQSLINEKNQDERLNKWLQNLRDEAFVEYRI